MEGLFDFLEEPQLSIVLGVEGSKGAQIGNHIQILNQFNDDWQDAEIVLLGCGALNNADNNESDWTDAADAVRTELYQMYDWHQDLKVADLGNIIQGATPNDTRAALRTVLKEIEVAGKVVILLGGSHDLMTQQYEVFEQNEKTIEAAIIDRFIDLDDTEGFHDRNFLMPMLTKQPNFVNHLSLSGFQSYDVNPNVLETFDKLGFDCIRLGKLREAIEEAEPVFRNCNLISMDMQVVRAADAVFLKKPSPNGLYGDEICQLAKYAGMSEKLSSFGIFGYQSESDTHHSGAVLIAQMLWYFVDGYRLRKQEANLRDTDNFISYAVSISGADAVFVKSNRTGRWWMQLPDLTYMPCSYQDYLTAGNNEIPDRWLRFQSRIV